MCNFCSEGKVIEVNWNELWLTDDNLKVLVAADGKYEYAEFQIKHCPMCGRKLGND